MVTFHLWKAEELTVCTPAAEEPLDMPLVDARSRSSVRGCSVQPKALAEDFSGCFIGDRVAAFPSRASCLPFAPEPAKGIEAAFGSFRLAAS
jgi:hypothetical protein